MLEKEPNIKGLYTISLGKLMVPYEVEFDPPLEILGTPMKDLYLSAITVVETVSNYIG